MFTTIAVTVAAVILAILTILIYAATRPGVLHVERSIAIKAPPEKIFTLINDFRLWDEWTPYNKDPAMKKTFSGSASGKGARYAWEGNYEVGQGEISVTDTNPPSRIAFELHMIKPFEARNVVVFTLKAAGDSTEVMWGMDGKQGFVTKLVGLCCSMDRMIGKDFEAGLAKLKAIAEK
jgi:uncharacterized protein YndB with AHSA1/START domain